MGMLLIHAAGVTTPMLKKLGLFGLTIFSIVTASQPVLAGPFVVEAERALLKCMTLTTEAACQAAGGAAGTIKAVALRGSSSANKNCFPAAMDLQASILDLQLGFLTGDSLLAKEAAYKQMAKVKKNCATF